jgi:tetratricopeptide (TPR) repeat protein
MFGQEISMRLALLCVVGALACAGGAASAQTADEQTIKTVVQAETKAWIDRNADAWQATWLQDETAKRVIVQASTYTSQKGWSNIAPPMLKDFKENPTPLPITPSIDQLVVRQQGDLAFVEYDQTTTAPGAAASPTPSREYRVLVKNGGQWKIASQITHVVNSFGDTPAATGGRINGVGQSLLRSGKVQEAIEIFKINARLSPEVAGAFLSLGQAYAAAGQNDLAIENYEKALKLNPKNENARKALEKLRSSK